MSAALPPVPIAEPARREAFQPSIRSQAAVVVAVAATYVYFLIFAQFGFLQAVAAVDSTHLKHMMTVMGAAGLAASAVAAWLHREERAKGLLRAGFGICAAAALLTVFAHQLAMLAVAAALTGGGMGLVTVTLATVLRREAGGAKLGVCLGTGTGLAYGLCNVPGIFNAGVAGQSLVALAACAAGWLALAAFRQPAPRPEESGGDYAPAGVVGWVAVFFALVWLDSAAFYIIQHTPEVKGGTWGGNGQLFLNGLVHILAAVLAGVLLDRRLTTWVVLLAVGSLTVACRLIEVGPGSLATAAFCYTLGVSFYSTALVHYPAYCGRVRVAAVVYAVAGWVGSALGIGMAENLGRVPGWFLAISAVVVLIAMLSRLHWSRAARTGGVTVLLLVTVPGSTADLRASPESVAAGRRFYLAEGCIHCHSQYVRPETADEDRYGPAHGLEELLGTRPPLLGNRRQGPDLLNVALRRTREWNRAHLIAPRSLQPGSRMPSYRYLFDGDAAAGEALLDYLDTLAPAGRVESVQ